MRDDPRAFADAVADVLHDAVLRRRLGQAGRATVERLYSWDAIAPGMIDTYLTLANVECSRSVSTASPVRQEARYGIG
jgi:glycosyltransferase involved in cell wall biosynthesis